MYNAIASARVKSCQKGLNDLYFLGRDNNCFVEYEFDCENGFCKNMLQVLNNWENLFFI